MLIHIDPNRGVPYYRQVKEQVTQMILTGQLKPGEQLESVSQLSRRLKVNPMTISKAYSFLVEEKLVERRPGIGIFVNDMDRSKKKELAEDKLSNLLGQCARLCIQTGLSKEEASVRFTEMFETILKEEKND